MALAFLAVRLVEHVGRVSLQPRHEAEVLEQTHQRAVFAEGDHAVERALDGVACPEQLVLGDRHQPDCCQQIYADPLDVAAELTLLCSRHFDVGTARHPAPRFEQPQSAPHADHRRTRIVGKHYEHRQSRLRAVA